MTDEPNIKNDDRLAGGGEPVARLVIVAAPFGVGAPLVRQWDNLGNLQPGEHFLYAAPVVCNDKVPKSEWEQLQNELAALRQRCALLADLRDNLTARAQLAEDCAASEHLLREQAEADARRYRFLADPQSIDPYGTHWCDAYNAVGDGRKKKEQIDEDVDTAIRVAALAHDAQDGKDG